MSPVAPPPRPIGLAYFSLYFIEYERAVAFYTELLGAHDEVAEDGRFHGWRIGDSWLTLFPADIGTAKGANPQNAEFALRMAAPPEVDELYDRLVDMGAAGLMAPSDTWMYEPMRYCCVDDPFGVRIDVYCPLPEHDTAE